MFASIWGFGTFFSIICAAECVVDVGVVIGVVDVGGNMVDVILLMLVVELLKLLFSNDVGDEAVFNGFFANNGILIYL